MIFSIPSYDKNVFSNLDIISSDRMFLTFGKLRDASRNSLIGPLPSPDSTAILVYDRHRNAWLDPLVLYKCIGVPFQILPFHEPLKFHLMCQLDSTVQKVTCVISDNMQSVRVTEAESLFTIVERLPDFYAMDGLKVYFESDHRLFASRATDDELIIYKIHDGMAVETKRIPDDEIHCVHYANRKLQFLHAPDYDQWLLSTFDTDNSELTQAQGLDLGDDESDTFCFGNDKLFRHSREDDTLYVYELAPPYANRRVCLLPLSGNNLVHSSDGQIWTSVSCRCMKGIISVWYEPPPLYDIALRAIHENLTVTAKRALGKSEDPPLFNYELLVDFVLSYKQDDDLSADSSEDDSSRRCDCAKHQYDSDDDGDSDSDGYVGNYAFDADSDGYFIDSDDHRPYMCNYYDDDSFDIFF